MPKYRPRAEPRTSANHDHQVSLAQSLDHLLGAHFGDEPHAARRPSFRPLDPGHVVVITPQGEIRVFRHLAGRVEPLDVLSAPPPGPHADPTLLLGTDSVGLPYGFAHSLLQTHAPRVALDMLVRGLPVTVGGRQAHKACAFSVPRAVLGRSGIACNVQAIMGEVRAFEDELCLGALSSLPHCGIDLPCVGRGRIGDLLELLGGMDAGRIPALFDTVFLGPACHALLGDYGLPDVAQKPHPNVLLVGEFAVIVHGRVSDGIAYFTSRKHGTTLVHGPTVLRCGEGEVGVEHHCHVRPARDRRAGAYARLRRM